MRWTEESVKLLISLYHEHEHKFADVNYKNKSVWEEIAKGMKEKNYHPTSTRCSNKWKKLKKSFVEVMQVLARTRNHPWFQTRRVPRGDSLKIRQRRNQAEYPEYR